MSETREKYFTLHPTETKVLPDCVLAFLRECRGRERAVTAPMLATAIHYHDPDGRKVRVVIADLIQHGHPIAAHAGGFYMIETADEAESYLQDLRHRAVMIHERYRAFSEAAQRLWNIPVEQLSLQFEEAK